MTRIFINHATDGMPQSVTFFIGPVGVVTVPVVAILALARGITDMARGVQEQNAKIAAVMDTI